MAGVLFALAASSPKPVPLIAEIDVLRLQCGVPGSRLPTPHVNRHGMGTPDRLAKGTPVRVRWRARAWSTRSRRRSGELAREAALGVCLDQARFLKRQLSLPVSTMSQWWVSRSSRAVVILASPKTLGHSPKARLVVTITELRS